MIERSTHPEYFQLIYARDADPWGYATSGYERDKYAATIAALPRCRFRRALEIGCSIGVLTRMLADRCDMLLAIDVSEVPLAAARERCSATRNVRLRRMRVPGNWPTGAFDLVILSEVLYYQSRADESATIRKTLRCLRAGAIVVLVHWLGETGTSRSGDAAAVQFIRQSRRQLDVVTMRRNTRYRLDVLAHR
jgi:SAM-dependent methyltransferase